MFNYISLEVAILDILLIKPIAMKSIIMILIWGVLLVGIWGSYGLAKDDWVNGDVCPKILGIPACYIILSCFLLAAVSHIKVLGDKFWLYFVSTGIAWSIATYGTLGETFGWAECPKTAGGTPMCYISFAMFSTLILLKIIHSRMVDKVKL